MWNININLKVIVTKISDNSNLISKNFLLFVKDIFIEESNTKSHNFSNHIENFKEKIKLNQQLDNRKDFLKYDIYYVNFWVNVWNEINWERPCLIFKSNRHNKWSDIIVIPMTWLLDINWKNKKLDKFDIVIAPDNSNKLKKESILRIRLIRSISKKRVWTRIGKLDNVLDNTYMYDLIDNKINSMLWIKKSL